MLEIKDGCSICDRIKRAKAGNYPGLIHEFPNSFLAVGDHQYHKGYCLLFLKYHVRELHELTEDQQNGLFRELMAATNAIVKTYTPWKMNHSCYGNVDEHVHWHLIPRYDDKGDHRTNPWLHADEFGKFRVDATAVEKIAGAIRRSLSFVPL
jgi:diadenosine tetraphosphate (Ap4A) HIT family hydrolase